MNQRQKLEELAIATLTEKECPDVEQLAEYTLGLLTGADQLRVAAHVRSCPFCSHDIAIARPPEAALQSLAAPGPAVQVRIARWIRPELAAGRYRGEGRSDIRQYAAAHLTINVTVSPPRGDYWRITGQVLREETGVADCIVTLRARRRRHEQITDSQGLFSFETIPAGRYTLSVTDGQTQVQIRGLLLSFEDQEPGTSDEVM